jgi:hypothetical protein
MVVFTLWVKIFRSTHFLYFFTCLRAAATRFFFQSLCQNKKERKMVLENLKADGKEIILITEDQVNNFAGNMLQVRGKDDKRYLVMSDSAYQSLTKAQIDKIEKHCEILHASLDIIEACGGGSARCMMARAWT